MTKAPMKPLRTLGHSVAVYARQLEGMAAVYLRTAEHLQRRTLSNTRLWSPLWSAWWGVLSAGVAMYFLSKAQRRFERVESIAILSDVDDLTR